MAASVLTAVCLLWHGRAAMQWCKTTKSKPSVSAITQDAGPAIRHALK